MHPTGMDNYFVVKAARRLLDGSAPYADKRFLYLPSSVIAALPEAFLSDRLLRPLVPAATAGGVLAGWWFSLRIFQVPLGSRLAVLVAGGLAYFAPFRSLVLLGNWTAFSAAALPLALLLALRSRWVWAGVVVGVAIATKPMLVPVALIFVFARRRAALVVAAAVPAGLSLLAGLAMPAPGYFFTKTLPFLLRGQDVYARPFDASLPSVLTRIGLPERVALGVAAVLAAAGVLAAWLRWRAGGPEPLRLVETGTMLMLAAFLVSRPSFDHYVLVVLPLLLASLPVVASAPRSPWFWIAFLPQIPVIQWPGFVAVERRAFKDAAMLGLLAAVVAWRCLAVRRAEPSPAPPYDGQPPATDLREEPAGTG